MGRFSELNLNLIVISSVVEVDESQGIWGLWAFLSHLSFCDDVLSVFKKAKYWSPELFAYWCFVLTQENLPGTGALLLRKSLAPVIVTVCPWSFPILNLKDFSGTIG